MVLSSILLSKISVVVLLANLLGSFAIQLNVAEFPLSRRSFSIRSTITIFNESSSEAANIIQVDETYSFEQRRARIQFLTLDDPNRVEEFFYNSLAESGIFSTRKKNVCRRGTLDDLHNYLFPRSNSLYTFINNTGSGQDINHIIGPARFLFFLTEPSSDGVFTEDDTSLVRNHPIVEYSLKSRENILVSIKYDKQDNDKSDNITDLIKSAIPIRISLNLNQDGIVQIDYYAHQLLEPTRLHTGFKDLSDKSSDKVIDEFAFPLSLNCTQHLSGRDMGHLFESYDLGSTRFSFIARTDQSNKEKSYRHFVAFDGFTRSMRIESKQTAYCSKRELRDNLHVLDFGTNRKYTIIENWSDIEDSESVLLSDQDEINIQSPSTHCSVTYISSPDRVNGVSTGLSNFLLGADRFAYMGRGEVRGVDARIYEIYSRTLPFWFSEPILYKDSKGNYATRGRLARVKENQDGSSRSVPGEYNIVVYVADDPSDQMKLLLMEVYDMKVALTSSYRTAIVAEFYDFIWDLSESPDGVRADELFSLKELCSAGPIDSRYAEVDMLLEEDKIISTASTETQWLYDSVKRNMALTAGVRDALEIQNIWFYDLESRVINNKSIAVSFRLAEHPQTMYEISFVGNAQLNFKSNTKMFSSTSRSLVDCLWMLGKSTKPQYLYYSETLHSCLMDPVLMKTSNVDIGVSQCFKLNPKGEGELYRFEPRIDREVNLATSWLREKKFRHLENRAMILQDSQSATGSRPIDINEFGARIRKIKLKSVNYMTRVAENPDEITSVNNNSLSLTPSVTVFSGFGLAADSSNHQSTRVNPDKEQQFPMSLDQCQAACLADFNCQSYSYCVRSGQVHCDLSDVSIFRIPGIRERLESRQVQRLPRGSIFQVPINGEKQLTSAGEVVGLVRDFKCELYHKIYMDLFRPSLPVKSTLKGLRLIAATGGVEECAKKCFLASLSSISSSVAMNKQVKEFVNGKSSSRKAMEKLEELKKRHKQAMAGFCQYFMYSDSSFNDEQTRLLERLQITEITGAGAPVAENSTTISGYCAFDDSDDGKHKGIGDNDETVMFKFNSFRFDFTTLYEKKEGFRLLESFKNEKEHDAYEAITARNSTNEDHYKLIQKSLNEGKNYQLTKTVDPIVCAEYCFLQTSGLWPACRSFDEMIVYFTFDESYESLCMLNTISMDTLADQQLVRRGQFKNTRMWHYEPRFGLVRQETQEAYDFDNALGAFESTLNSNKFKRLVSKIDGHLVGGFGMFMMLTLGIASGLFLGVQLARRLNSTGRDRRFSLGFSESATIITPSILVEMDQNQQTGAQSGAN